MFGMIGVYGFLMEIVAEVEVSCDDLDYPQIAWVLGHEIDEMIH